MQRPIANCDASLSNDRSRKLVGLVRLCGLAEYLNLLHRGSAHGWAYHLAYCTEEWPSLTLLRGKCSAMNCEWRGGGWRKSPIKTEIDHR